MGHKYVYRVNDNGDSPDLVHMVFSMYNLGVEDTYIDIASKGYIITVYELENREPTTFPELLALYIYKNM